MAKFARQPQAEQNEDNFAKRKAFFANRGQNYELWKEQEIAAVSNGAMFATMEVTAAPAEVTQGPPWPGAMVRVTFGERSPLAR